MSCRGLAVVWLPQTPLRAQCCSITSLTNRTGGLSRIRPNFMPTSTQIGPFWCANIWPQIGPMFGQVQPASAIVGRNLQFGFAKFGPNLANLGWTFTQFGQSWSTYCQISAPGEIARQHVGSNSEARQDGQAYDSGARGEHLFGNLWLILFSAGRPLQGRRLHRLRGAPRGTPGAQHV